MLSLKTFFLLTLVLSFIMEIQSSEAKRLPSTPLTLVDFNNIPHPGKTAFIASVPGRPEEGDNNRVIFIPSQHNLPSSLVDPSIIKIIRGSDILIVESFSESVIGLNRRNPAKRFESILDEFPKYNKEILHAKGLFSDTKEFIFKEKPWTDHLDPQIKSFLEQSTEKFRDNIPLSHMNPYLIKNVLETLKRLDAGDIVGMDAKLKRLFIDQNKLIISLETREEALPDEMKSWEIPYFWKEEEWFEAAISFVNREAINYMFDNPELNVVPDKAILNMDEINLTSSQKESAVRRNHLWIPRILKYLNINPNKSIAVVVGAAHFNGPDGLLSLLSKEGFSFSSMILKLSDSKPSEKGGTIDELVVKRNKLMDEIAQKDPTQSRSTFTLDEIKKDRVRKAFAENTSQNDKQNFQQHLIQLPFAKEKLERDYDSMLSVEREIQDIFEPLKKAVEENKISSSLKNKVNDVIKSWSSIKRQADLHISEAKEIIKNLNELIPTLNFNPNSINKAQEDIRQAKALITEIESKMNGRTTDLVGRLQKFQEGKLLKMTIVNE